jgi:hypothetical protein
MSVTPFTLACACLAAGLGIAALPAQVTAPAPKQIPVPRITGPLGKLPDAGELPLRPGMPDVLTMNDGTKVATPAQWAKRREEMKRILEYYAVGQMPPPPGNVKGVVLRTETVAGGTVLYRLVHLSFGPGGKLALDLGIFTPATGGRFPAVITPGGTPPGGAVLPRLPLGPNQGKGEDVLLRVGPEPTATTAGDPAGYPLIPGRRPSPAGAHPTNAEEVAADPIHAAVLRRGYALVTYEPNDCAEDTTLRNLDGSWAFRSTRFFPAYPGYDWGILAAWAWGASRIADYLETDPRIDATKLVITGASRSGKAAMIAAAFDERLMGAPVVTGGGGLGAYRFAGPRRSETLDIMATKYPNWFSPNLHEFRGQRERLPFDQHWFLALAAPRPFLALEGDADTISLPEAVRQSFLGARPAYALLGAADRLGVNYAKHAHTFNEDDWSALLDFADKHLRGLKVDRPFDRFPTEAELDAAAAAPAGAGTPPAAPATLPSAPAGMAR